MAQQCDKYGFFNGVMGIEQSNWANYWRGLIADGIIARQGDEMEVYVPVAGEGMQIRIKTGQAMVDNHRAWLTTEKILPLENADTTNPRIDLVVLRAVYGNEGESVIYVDVKTGTPAASPAVPDLTQVSGETYEIPLAQIAVGKSVTTIIPSNITDLRYVFQLPKDKVSAFTGTTVTLKNDYEYRNSSAISSLVVNLPQNPNPTFIAQVNFTSSSSFSAVTVNRGSTKISGTSNLKLKGDALTVPSRRYNITFYWDGSYYWAACAAV